MPLTPSSLLSLSSSATPREGDPARKDNRGGGGGGAARHHQLPLPVHQAPSAAATPEAAALPPTPLDAATAGVALELLAAALPSFGGGGILVSGG
jgi:hypothetical protein